MNEVKAKITLKDNTIVYINADFANYNNISNDTEFYNNIYLNFLDHNVLSDNLDISFKNNILEAYGNLSYKNLDFKMIADKIEINLLNKNSKFITLINQK